jgi:hypothetical protein
LPIVVRTGERGGHDPYVADICRDDTKSEFKHHLLIGMARLKLYKIINYIAQWR